MEQVEMAGPLQAGQCNQRMRPSHLGQQQWVSF